MIKNIFLFVFAASIMLSSQELKTPCELNNYKQLTSYEELSNFVNKLPSASPLVKVSHIGVTLEGRTLYAIKLSKGIFGKDKSKIKILILAQQHGNEPSGKEGALLLAKELIKAENKYLFKKVDIAIVPIMNPDGAEKNQRRNSVKVDLNRNHLILTQAETIALHKLFNQYLFEVTMDVHEYSPFGSEAEKYGYRKNTDEQIGCLTNINISNNLRDIQINSAFPFIKEYLNKNNFSCFVYNLGTPEDSDFVRHSTFDINDGRQSFGILGTFSFIQEGLNAPEYSIENIEHRAKGQMIGMRALIEYSYQNKDMIQKLVKSERENLTKKGGETAIQMNHFADGTILQMPMLSYYSNNDTLVTVKNYRPIVKSLLNAKVPKGYLIPKDIPELKTWMINHTISYKELPKNIMSKIEEYFVINIDSIDFEGDKVINPQMQVRNIDFKTLNSKYWYVPVNQLHKNVIVTALEPNSMIGLATYKEYEKFVQINKPYPILIVR